ncbi:DUF2752 domain-containing protein [uncultured Ruthenibacterium sp.]|uniref:DUF2752 domain-containing protein n=1 Tax=uncultured Ruthenibacterium sp. TaxID=1905347 RepID=UPI00349EA27B
MNDRQIMRRRRVLFGFVAVCILYGGWVLYTGKGIPCIFHSITGLFCPGCGITRSLTALVCLDLKTALHSNAAVVLLLPFWVWLVWKMATGYLRGTGFSLSRAQNRLVWGVLLFVLAFGIARNIPCLWFLRPIE